MSRRRSVIGIATSNALNECNSVDFGGYGIDA